MTEANSCLEFVTPKLVEVGWGAAESVIGEQHGMRLSGRLESDDRSHLKRCLTWGPTRVRTDGCGPGVFSTPGALLRAGVLFLGCASGGARGG